MFAIRIESVPQGELQTDLIILNHRIILEKTVAAKLVVEL